MDEPGELRRVLLADNARLHQFGISADDLQRRLHLMAHVRGEFAARLHGRLQFLVLPAQLVLLIGDALHQRPHLHVDVVVQGIAQVHAVDRTHDVARQHTRQTESHGHDKRRRQQQRGKHAL